MTANAREFALTPLDPFSNMPGNGYPEVAVFDQSMPAEVLPFAAPSYEAPPVVPSPEAVALGGTAVIGERAPAVAAERHAGRNELRAAVHGLTATLEAKSARLREQIDEDIEKGDQALLHIVAPYIKRERAVADDRFVRNSARHRQYAARAQRHEESHNPYSWAMKWVNRGFAAFFGWRARSAKRLYDYYSS